MSVETPIRRKAPARPRRSTTDRLRTALAVLGEHQGQVLTYTERPWASITFAGARHSFAILFSGDDAVASGERFVAALHDHEFAIPGQLVADANIIEVEQRMLPTPRMVVQCELLLLEDG